MYMKKNGCEQEKGNRTWFSHLSVLYHTEALPDPYVLGNFGNTRIAV